MDIASHAQNAIRLHDLSMARDISPLSISTSLFEFWVIFDEALKLRKHGYRLFLSFIVICICVLLIETDNRPQTILKESTTDKQDAGLGSDRETQPTYGVHYWEPGSRDVYEAPLSHLYFFKSYIGSHTITVERGDCVFWLSEDQVTACLERGPTVIESAHIASVIRGYMPENRSATIVNRTVLPYVNGCSTKQVFAPERLGDPTLQKLYIPPYSSEQAHHIHSTVRVVYILKGSGVSVVGMEGCKVNERLIPGKVCILEPMCPHHFETPDGESLEVLPLHVFSSVGSEERAHPMFHGTHLMSQGK